jgi:hypothetical protein
MQPSRPLALLLGGTGRYPFNGHLRLVAGRGAAVLHVAGCVAPGASPPVAWAAAGVLRRAFQDIEARNRNLLLRAAWDALRELDPTKLGPPAGEDLALLLLAIDETGTGVAATGLSSVYMLRNGTFEALVPPDHPLLATTGVPASPPGVLTLTEAAGVLVGAPRSGSRELPSDGDWRAACGDRDG